MSKTKDARELLSKPGDVIVETLDHIKMTQAELALRMGKTPSKINDLITGKEPITVTTAIQLEKVLGIDAHFWLNREALFREKLARIEQEELLEEWTEWLDSQPIKDLKAAGYISNDKKGLKMAEETLKFYGVATPKQWADVYLEGHVQPQYRKSAPHQTSLGSMAAWLRMGELAMRKLVLPPYNKDTLKKNLSLIRELVRSHPEDFAEQLREYARQAGVAIVYTINVSKAPISGAVRWIGGNPLIQLTDRYKTNDHFWFTVFHEFAHILLHGKKEVFIEEFEEFDADEAREKEANEFAGQTLLPEDITAELPRPITEKDVRAVARKYNTHSAIVLARLQREEIVSYSFGTSLRIMVKLDHVIDRP